MQNDHTIVARVYEAKHDMQKADDLIRDYIPFIRAEVAKVISRICTEQDDEFSIGMIAFHEAIGGYTRLRGAFLKYAALTIKSRLIDFQRKEARHQGQVSLYEQASEDDRPLHELLADERDHYAVGENLEATQHEIAELSAVMAGFGVSLTDVAENSPKQERTLEACRKVVRYAAANRDVLEELLRTKKLPMAALVTGAQVEKKTLERHRKYVVAMLLIQTNGYEIIRGHLRHILVEKGGAAV